MFLCKFDVFLWTSGDVPITHEGEQYAPNAPITEIFGIGVGSDLSKTKFGIRLSDPEFTFRDRYEPAYINKELRLLYLPAPGASGIAITVGYCVSMSSVTEEQGRVTSFEFANRLARLGGTKPRRTTEAIQRDLHPGDSSMDVAQDTLAISWGTSIKS